MNDNPFEPRTVEELPDTLAVFPLAGATLLPGTQLPLNIFEPRYLNMVLDALSSPRMIGMIQPDPGRATSDSVPVYSVGCAGRIVAFNETEDGRLLISLQGVCRFRAGQELALHRGYRRMRADFQPFAADLERVDSFALERESLRQALSAYLDGNGIRVDWDALEKMSDARMVDFLSMHLPLAPEDKQALVEAPDVATRARDLMALTHIAAVGESGGGATRH